ncbi:hypothetical protein OG762_01110 [Streptomyces sp. NBC_01136]|nr:hypothetical protein OG762_01110 [Streptomyces sp. NBC_01136]
MPMNADERGSPKHRPAQPFYDDADVDGTLRRGPRPPADHGR